MEAVPRLHMLWFALKSSPEGTSFANLKKYIAEFYQEDPDSYTKEVFALETLRNQSMHPTKDGCSVMKRYYCQLHSLQNRFPQLTERGIFTFTWKDLYQSNVNEVTDIRYELAAVLFNIAASHTQVGASVTRGDVDGMKMACTHFQCAAWAFGELRERYTHINSGTDFMTTELLVFMQQVSFAQAQECILEKSLIDNRKPNIVAKVTAQIVVYYGAALAALLTGGDDGPVAQVIDNSVYKLWKKYVRFKISYLNCILYLYQGQNAEEQQKMGERVTLYQAAWDKLEDARKESKGLPDQKEINESLIFTADVVEAKRKNAKNENEFIYHEAVPELTTISAVQGANLVNGISFSVTDPDIAGDDIFARLVPMKAHEASSMYSEEKAKLLRKYGGLIEDKDAELASFMSSLTLEHLNINDEKANKIPQGIVDRSAALNANKTAIPDLISAMSQLAEICADVEMNLKEIAAILAEEERQEREFQTITGVKRMQNAHITELSREYQKYTEAHARAGESNDTLRKAMELHVNNLKILARPLQEIQQSVPKLSSELNTTEIFKDVKLILNKVNEMKAQRSQFHADLRIAVNEDDITAKVIAHGTDEGLQTLFDREIGKHERLTQLLDQNLLAQMNILQALTESYAKAAPVLKTLADVKHKRESFFSSLAASYDVYEDLLAKSAKGLEFYKKLAGNVQKLLTRFKSARDVQSEERQQRLKSVSRNTTSTTATSVNTTQTASAGVASSTPKLRDYLKAKNSNANMFDNARASTNTNAMMSSNQNASYIPSVRPNPLGSETPTQPICSSGYYPTAVSSVAPNEPPPPYSLQQVQYYDPTNAGYTNPIYQKQQQQQQLQQQNIAPPAYTLQASPNSQFSNFNASMANLSLQGNYGGFANQQLSQQQHQMSQMSQMPQMPTNIPANSNTSYIPHSQQSSNLPNPYASNIPMQPPANYNYMGTYAVSNAQVSTAMPSAPGASSLAATQTYTPAINSAANQYTSSVYEANASNVNYSQPLLTTRPGVAAANALYPTQDQLSASQAQQSYTLQTGIPSTATTVPTSQPLYVATSQQSQIAVNPAPSPYVDYHVQQLGQMQTQQPIPQQPIPQQPMPQQPIPQQSMPQQPMPQQSMPQQPMPQQQQQSFGIPSGTNAATLHADAAKYSTFYGSATKHPGYSYNAETGAYEYGSGYQQGGSTNPQFYGQYTTASAAYLIPSVDTTDSRNAKKTNVATGFDAPIISHAKSGGANVSDKNSSSYYIQPYGYQSAHTPTSETIQHPSNVSAANNVPQTTTESIQTANMTGPPQQAQQKTLTPQHSIYMQSGSASIANTQTTKSAAEYASSSHLASTINSSPSASASAPTPPPTSMSSTPTPTPKPTDTDNSIKKKSSNIDLLTDIDFSGVGVSVPPPILPEPVLKPEVLASPSTSQVSQPIIKPTVTAMATTHTVAAISTDNSSKQTIEEPSPAIPVTNTTPPLPMASVSTQLPISNEITSVRKTSCDNISISSDLSSLDNNFDWDSVSMRGEKLPSQMSNAIDVHSNTTFLLKPLDPFADDKTLKYFHKEVERYEKTIESLNVKMLNGNTQLLAKWKELQDMLAKESSKRTTTIAKLFPEKNRSLDCLPYDHARVKLEKNTDDYINAAYIKDLGNGCPNVIIAQTPQQNTLNDFWSMIWSQKARTVLCLHTLNEMLDPYWPQELNAVNHFDDFYVQCVKINPLSHCTEYYIKLSMHGADAVIDLTVLQIKSWTKSSPSQIIGVARNALQAHQARCLQFNTPGAPLIMNCLTGSERSELIAVAICAIVATQIKRPLLINVVDVWYRICAQRQNALRSTANLEQSMQIVLNNAHDVLNKRGIMTSYQMKIAPQVASKEKEELKDPLNELDPLWKLK